MARKARAVSAFIGIYPSVGTRAKTFLSVLQIKVRGRTSELKGRERIKSWTVKAHRPLALVHVRYPVRLELLPFGTAAYDRGLKTAKWDLEDAPEPEVLALVEGEPQETELVVGMLIRHGEELGIYSVYIVPRYPTKSRR